MVPVLREPGQGGHKVPPSRDVPHTVTPGAERHRVTPIIPLWARTGTAGMGLCLALASLSQGEKTSDERPQECARSG